MRNAITIMLLSLALVGSTSARKKAPIIPYDLTMTATYTEGHSRPDLEGKTTYHSGDYDCTEGDEHNAPDCRTSTEWAELQRIGGTPDTVLFTMADGSQVGVQSPSINKVYDITCGPSTPIVFCYIYYKLFEATLVDTQKPGKFGQTEFMSPEESSAAQDALRKKLFGIGNQMKTTMHYRLEGEPDKNGFQKIEIEGVDKGIRYMVNPFGDGYYVGARATMPKPVPVVNSRNDPAGWHNQYDCEADGFVWRDGVCSAAPKK